MPSQTSRGYEYPVSADDIGDLPGTVQDLAETIEAQLKRIESGTGASGSLTTGNGADVSITFAAAFAAAPKVTVTTVLNGTLPGATCWVKSRSTTGAVIRVHNATGATTAVGFDWHAQG